MKKISVLLKRIIFVLGVLFFLGWLVGKIEIDKKKWVTPRGDTIKFYKTYEGQPGGWLSGTNKFLTWRKRGDWIGQTFLIDSAHAGYDSVELRWCVKNDSTPIIALVERGVYTYRDRNNHSRERTISVGCILDVNTGEFLNEAALSVSGFENTVREFEEKKLPLHQNFYDLMNLVKSVEENRGCTILRPI